MTWFILLVAAVSCLWVLLTIDDWRRDWTTNFAETRADAADPWLRPLRSSQPPAAQAERIAAWARDRWNWTCVSIEDATSGESGSSGEDGSSGVGMAPGQVARPAGTEEGVVRMHLVRTTPLLRFRDDIHVMLTPTPDGGSRLEATSRSRVGKGDLGQNPRNLRELMRGLAE